MRVTPARLACALLALSACGRGDTPTSLTAVGPTLPSFTLSGVVRESVQNGARLPGAVVQLIGKPGVIASTRSDADGRFTFRDVSGRMQLSASKNGYRTATVTIGPVTSDTSADLALEPVPRVVFGRVVETPPTQTKGVAGARVEVVNGTNADRAATTDANGDYRLERVWGDFQVRVTAAGYTTAVVSVSIGDADTAQDVQLSPAPRVITETITSPGGVGSRRVIRVFDVHNDGEFAITDLAFYGFEEGDGCVLELWEGPQLVARSVVERSFPRKTTALRVPVVAGHRYEARVLPFFFVYTVTLQYPN